MTDESAYSALGLFIDGEWIGADERAGQEVVNPADETVLAALPHATADDLARVVDGARRGLSLWRDTKSDTRSAVLQGAAELVRARRDDLALIMTLEQGKTLAEAGLEWDRVADTFDWHAAAAGRIGELEYPARGGNLRQTSRPEPLGVALALTAWNFPAILPARKLAPALVAGCSVILKAAEETPASACELVRILSQAGLPPGVVSLVFGDPAEVSETLLSRPEVRKLSFTGSVPVGKELARLAAADLKRCTLELGGHAPVLVMDDAEVTAAAEMTAAFKYRNAGQVCIAPSRFFVQEAVFAPFVEAFLGYARTVTVGDGRDPATTMGPMANPRRLAAMDRFMADASEKGAATRLGGGRLFERGYFWAPTVLTELPDEAAVLREETFGPIAPIVAVADEAEALARANALPYGLASYVFTGSPERAERLAAGLEAGSVAVNTLTPAQPDTPFGGVKDSGYGYEGGLEGIDSYLHKKLISSVGA